MLFSKRLLKAAFVTGIISVSIVPAVQAQDQLPEIETPQVVTETFDGDDKTLMLGGQISFFDNNPPWAVYIADESLVMENRQDPRSLQFQDISWVRFPGEDTMESTEDLVISAIVDSDSDGFAGAGILVGSGTVGVYTAFAVDEKGRFGLVKKDGRKLRIVNRGKHDAIVVGGPNKLTFQARGAHILFFVNGEKIIQIPFSKRTTNGRQSEGRAGIGLAALGTGTFRFEEVEISRPN